MGYSCSRDAANTLGVIGKMFATDGNPNTLTIKNQRYFFERGGEQRDGAITGTLYRMLPNEMCRRVGPTRINADGTIARFPVITAADRVEAVSTMRDLSASNLQLLHAWTSGRL